MFIIRKHWVYCSDVRSHVFRRGEGCSISHQKVYLEGSHCPCKLDKNKSCKKVDIIPQKSTKEFFQIIILMVPYFSCLPLSFIFSNMICSSLIPRQRSSSHAVGKPHPIFFSSVVIKIPLYLYISPISLIYIKFFRCSFYLTHPKIFILEYLWGYL